MFIASRASPTTHGPLMNSSDNLTDNEIAFAAINLFANKPTGPEPDWQEIEDWHMDVLDDVRADQVLSHIANNPECFQMWRDICEAAELLEQSPLVDEAQEIATAAQNSTTNPAAWDLVGWLTKGAKSIFNQPLPAIGGAVAATVFAVMIVPKLLTSPSVNPTDLVNSSLTQYAALGAPLPQTPLQANTTRSLAGVLGNLSADEVEKHHINHGLRLAFDSLSIDNKTQGANDNLAGWMPWRESLPESSFDCTLAADSQHCANVSNDMNMLGQWALVTHLSCVTGNRIPADLTSNSTIDAAYQALVQLDTIKASTLLTPLVSGELYESGDRCVLANGLISIASEQR